MKNTFRNNAPALAICLVALLTRGSGGAWAQDRGLDLKNKEFTPGHYYALVIGNNTYQSIASLKTAEDDAKEVEHVLRSQYGFETKLLLNATRQQILSALNTYRKALDSTANLLIYYAGHGYNDHEADKAYWMPIDASLDDNSNWISADDITTSIKTIPAKHVLIVSDSCYSGMITRGVEASLAIPSVRQNYLQKMLAGKSRTIMASGGNEPVADGGGGKHSVFANALLRGLQQVDKGQFTAAELFRSYIQERVAGGANQTPEYDVIRNSGHDSGDFVFVRTDGGHASASAGTASTHAEPATIGPAAFELSYWDTIKHSSEPEDFQAYLEKYPHGHFAALARRRAAKKVALEAQQGAASTTANKEAAVQHAEAGIRYLEAEHWVAAETEYRLAIRLDGANARNQNYLGTALNYQKKYVQAEAVIREALRLEPSNAKYYNHLGYSLAAQSKYAEAEAAYREAIRLDPANPIYKDNLKAAIGNQKH